MTLSDFLEAAKSGGRITLTTLARDIGVRPSTLHDIKTGRRRPSLFLALKIEESTGGAVTPSDLAGVATHDGSGAADAA